MAVFPGNPLMCTGIVFWVFFLFSRLTWSHHMWFQVKLTQRVTLSLVGVSCKYKQIFFNLRYFLLLPTRTSSTQLPLAFLNTLYIPLIPEHNRPLVRPDLPNDVIVCVDVY